MRSAIIFHLVSGDGWFSAGVLIVLLLALELGGVFLRRPAFRVVARSLFLLAIGVAALSGTPTPLWLLIPLSAAIIAVIATGFRPSHSRVGRVASIAAIVLVAAALATELRWRRMPPLDSAPRSIVVIGDSLSSGGFGEAATWPELLAKRIGIPVTSLALPGETASSAMNQVSELSDAGAGSLVLIEIGGNDLLEGGSVERFERDLSALLESARRSRAEQVVLFELPIPPGRWRWGAVQREVARRHEVAMIPKRVLARLLTSADLVEDGLHPTDAGHTFLADQLARIVSSGAAADEREPHGDRSDQSE